MEVSEVIFLVFMFQKNLRIWEKLQGLCDHGLQSLDLAPDILNKDPGLRDLVSFIRYRV